MAEALPIFARECCFAQRCTGHPEPVILAGEARLLQAGISAGTVISFTLSRERSEREGQLQVKAAVGGGVAEWPSNQAIRLSE